MQSRPENSETQERCQVVAVQNLVAAKGCFAREIDTTARQCQRQAKKGGLIDSPIALLSLQL